MYSFAAEPKTIKQKSLPDSLTNKENKALITHLQQIPYYENVMFDGRVYRGNTNSINFVRKYYMAINQNRVFKSSKSTNKQPPRKSLCTKNNPNLKIIGGGSGSEKVSRDVYTESHLIEMVPRVPRHSIGLDAQAIEKPFVVSKQYRFNEGTDQEIQVDERDLIDLNSLFDCFVSPLVSRVLSESLREVQQETEYNVINEKLFCLDEILNKRREKTRKYLEQNVVGREMKTEGTRLIVSGQRQVIRMSRFLECRQYGSLMIKSVIRELNDRLFDKDVRSWGTEIGLRSEVDSTLYKDIFREVSQNALFSQIVNEITSRPLSM